MSPMSHRRGFTLLEIVVVLTLLGLVLALVVPIGTALQRQLADAGDRAGTLERLRDASAILPMDLRALSSPGGEITAAEARDSSLQVQITLAGGVLCGVTGTSALLALGTRADGTVRPGVPAVGDTLWVLEDRDSVERWVPLAAHAVGVVPAPCGLARGSGTGAVLDTLRVTSVDVGVALGDSASPPLSTRDSAIARIGIGAPVRITRPTRYSYYRGADGRWYLGLREWSGTSGSFQIVQPVSGPFRAPAAGQGSGLAFRYFDSTGAAVAPGAIDTRGIALVELSMHPLVRRTAGSSRPWGATDSFSVAVSLRNRRP